jgi:hypothetical protein
MVFIRLERPESREGIHLGCLGNVQKRSKRFRREAVALRDDHRFMGLEHLLLCSGRRRHQNAHRVKGSVRP